MTDNGKYRAQCTRLVSCLLLLLVFVSCSHMKQQVIISRGDGDDIGN